MSEQEKLTTEHRSHPSSPTLDGARDQPKPPFGKRVKVHLKKWWWLHLLVFVVVVLVIVLPLVFVGIPNIAQDQVNDSTLEVRLQRVTYPRPESVQLEMTNIAKSDSNFQPILDGFDGALFLESTLPDIKPFGYLSIPSTQVQAETTIAINQTFNVTNMDQFTEYNKLVLNSEEFRLAVRGKTKLHQKGLRAIDINYNKVVTQKGLDGFKGMTIPDFNISLVPDQDGSNLHGKVIIPNPSVLYLELGRVVLNLFVGDTYIGNSTIGSLTLEPEKDNEFEMTSITNQSIVLGLISSTYKDGILPLTIVGNSSTNLVGEHLTYYEEAMASNPIQISLDVGSRLNALLSAGGS